MQIEKRNKRCLEGNGEADFYLDEGLMSKLVSKFEEPSSDEVDVWYENNHTIKKNIKCNKTKKLIKNE